MTNISGNMLKINRFILGQKVSNTNNGTIPTSHSAIMYLCRYNVQVDLVLTLSSIFRSYLKEKSPRFREINLVILAGETLTSKI